ncbi:MAG: DNA-processing protein DprA [Actinobacteria bacterium]|nr:DNA-processing protein DprA [Actinomycetota bacterium]MBU1494898.1 DNA-processing protein DprA [Actinomycetota bacterium]MBU1866748.1 DNA-processing protein DprA [Actinomycetota bacterium]
MSRDARLRLAMAGLHPDRARALVESFGSETAVLRAVERGRIEVSRRAAAALSRPAAEIREMLDGLGVRLLWRGGPGYPESLEGLPDAPDVLFMRGRLPECPAVAVVGTRRCTAYGRAIARAYGSAIAGAGWTTVSGLARGIDAEAHLGTLEGGGPGVAVLGSGSNVVYPSEHRGIHDGLIASGGAVVTEYPPGTPPEPWRFPPRNRIIAGLSAAVVVVEAAVKGGALITASAAADQGKVVLAVPGDVGREVSEGCNLLIRDGAVPVLGPDDLVEALSLIVGPARPRSIVIGPADEADRTILAALGPAGAPVEAVVAATGLPVAQVLSRLVRLETEGRIARQGSRVVEIR